jgi:hypothetical protein
MGVTIHFRGIIDPGRVPALADDVKSIADHYGWGYVILRNGKIEERVEPTEPDTESPDARSHAIELKELPPLTGIIVHPGADCDSLSLLFDDEGYATDLVHWLQVQEGLFSREEVYVFCKTQFTRLENHVVIAELLKYVGREHFTTLEVVDEGKYYETGDFQTLEQLRATIGRWLDRIAEGLSRIPLDAETEIASPQALADRIEKMVRGIWDRERRIARSEPKRNPTREDETP